MKNLMSITDLTVEEIDELMAVAEDIIANPVKYQDSCRHKLLATLFFEPSTRTRLSFEAAMHRLGGSVIGFSDSGSSSSTKGESLSDTAQVVGSYVDIIAMRHPKEGAPYVASQNASIPVINAGDGGHLHPTQTLTDLLTMKEEKGRLENLTIGICGDLKNGRTVHSLIKAMSCFKGNKFVLISTKELALPMYIKDLLSASGLDYKEVTSLDEVMDELDVLYMTRIQRERFASEEEYQAQKGCYILDHEKMLKAKSDLIVLHPLPRVDEIAIEVDDDSRAMYFEQAKYGMYVRMALILTILKKDGTPAPLVYGKCHSGVKCSNPKCITNYENEPITPIFNVIEKNPTVVRCHYCEKLIKSEDIDKQFE